MSPAPASGHDFETGAGSASAWGRAPANSEFGRLEVRLGQQLEHLQHRMDRAHEATAERLDRLAEALSAVAALQSSIVHYEQRIDHAERRHAHLADRVADLDRSVNGLRVELAHWERTGKILWAVGLSAIAAAVWIFERVSGA